MNHFIKQSPITGLAGFGGGSSGLVNAGSIVYGFYGDRGILAGGFRVGDNYLLEDICYIDLTSLGNTSDFGDLDTKVAYCGMASDGTTINMAGGWDGTGVNSNRTTRIEKVVSATLGNGTDQGDLTVGRNDCSAVGGSGRAVNAGGAGGASGIGEVMDYWTISTNNNATDFGDLTDARGSTGAASNGVRGLWAGGESGVTDTIDYCVIMTTGNATDFGDLTQSRYRCGGVGNDTRSVWAMGYGGGTYLNIIDYVTTDTTGNASDFGDSVYSKECTAACNNATRGLWAAGSPAGGVNNYHNAMEYITIATTANATATGTIGGSGGQGRRGTTGASGAAS